VDAADFAAHIVAPAIEDISEGDATVTATGNQLVVRTGPGDAFTVVVTQTRRAPGWEE
jgi:hypothetical protein